MRSMPKPFSMSVSWTARSRAKRLGHSTTIVFTGDPLQHSQEAGALGHGISAAHGGIVEPGSGNATLLGPNLGIAGEKRCFFAETQIGWPNRDWSKATVIQANGAQETLSAIEAQGPSVAERGDENLKFGAHRVLAPRA